MNMPQNTAPEPYQHDPSDVKPKSKTGKNNFLKLLKFPER